MQVGDAHGGRAHIDTAAVLPEIERRADDGDVGAWHIPHCSDGVRAEGRARRLEWYNSGDRRGGRVVDRTRLESGRTLTGTGSSNLPLSASHAMADSGRQRTKKKRVDGPEACRTGSGRR